VYIIYIYIERERDRERERSYHVVFSALLRVCIFSFSGGQVTWLGGEHVR